MNMLDSDNKNNATMAKVLDSVINLEETEGLMESKDTQHTQAFIEFQDLCYSVSCNKKGDKKTILSNVTGHFNPKKVTVIIGQSGAGKTSLLQIVSGQRYINIEGTISINGVQQNKGSFRKHICYVPQQFALLPHLTTKETLYIAARLKLEPGLSNQTIYEIVNDIAESLSLSNCLNTMVNKLSGGEQKRLSVGVEMVTKPTILLLDEPTSGLDSVTSYQLINVLCDMAKANCTVVCAIHQPSSEIISQIDDIIVLNDGRCMYCGPKDEILNIFDKAGFICPSFYNIAEFVLQVVSGRKGGNLDNLYEISRKEYKKINSHQNGFNNDPNISVDSKYNFQKDDSLLFTNSEDKILSTWQQQKILFLRALICIKRDPLLTKVRLIAHIIVPVLISIPFYNFGDNAEKVLSNMSYLFFLVLFLYHANAFALIHLFPTEVAVLLREHLNNWYSLKSYFSVKVLMDLPVQIMSTSIFIIISYYLTGQPMEYHRILQVWIICLLIAIIGQSSGTLTGAVLNPVIGVFFMAILTIPLILYAGFFIKFEEMSSFTRPLAFLSFIRYAFEGLMQAIYMDRKDLSCPIIYCYLKSPKKILKIMDMPMIPFYLIFIILCFYMVCIYVLTYIVLRLKIYYARK